MKCEIIFKSKSGIQMMGHVAQPPQCCDYFAWSPIGGKVSTTHLKYWHPNLKYMGPRSSNELQWLYLDIGYQDSSLDNAHQGDIQATALRWCSVNDPLKIAPHKHILSHFKHHILNTRKPLEQMYEWLIWPLQLFVNLKHVRQIRSFLIQFLPFSEDVY